MQQLLAKAAPPHLQAVPGSQHKPPCSCRINGPGPVALYKSERLAPKHPGPDVVAAPEPRCNKLRCGDLQAAPKQPKEQQHHLWELIALAARHMLRTLHITSQNVLPCPTICCWQRHPNASTAAKRTRPSCLTDRDGEQTWPKGPKSQIHLSWCSSKDRRAGIAVKSPSSATSSLRVLHCVLVLSVRK